MLNTSVRLCVNYYMYLEGITCLVKQSALNRKQPALFQVYVAV